LGKAAAQPVVGSGRFIVVPYPCSTAKKETPRQKEHWEQKEQLETKGNKR